MKELHPDLLSVLDAVVIHSPTRFAVRDQIHGISGPSLDDVSTDAVAARERALLSALEAAIYQCLYIRPAALDLARPCDELARRERLSALSAANTGRGSWNGGWVVREIERDGGLALSKDDFTVWAAADQLRAHDGEIRTGQICSLWLSKEQRNRIHGFYIAVGDAQDEADEDQSEPLLRYYWHLSSEAAVPFVAMATELLNAAGAPFRLKVLADPGAFRRADAAVIFVRRQYHVRLGDAIARIHDAVAAGLRESVPLFTKPVARGLGAAEGPCGRLSFGEHRCKLAARAFWRSFLRGEHDRGERAATLAMVYEEDGLDSRYPYLAPGSADESRLALARGATGGPAHPSDSGIRVSKVVMPNGPGCWTISPREAAIRIGESLCRKAVWDCTGRYCNWMGRVSSRDGGTESYQGVTLAALGPSLHEGSAGIALFLAHLHAATGNDEFRSTALGAIARSMIRLSGPPPADPCSTEYFLGEDAGVAYAAQKVAALTRDPPILSQFKPTLDRLVELGSGDRLFESRPGTQTDPRCRSGPTSDAGTAHAKAREAAMVYLHAALVDPGFNERHLAAVRVAIEVVLGAIDERITVPRFDTTVRDGLAGSGEIVLTAGIMLEDRSYRDRALALSRTLIDRYSELDNWPTGLPCGGPNPSLWLGTAGIGYWLLRLDDPANVPPIVLLSP